MLDCADADSLAVYSVDSVRLRTFVIDESCFDASDVLVAKYLMSGAAFAHTAPALQSG
jgi:hypothetical protein